MNYGYKIIGAGDHKVIKTSTWVKRHTPELERELQESYQKTQAQERQQHFTELEQELEDVIAQLPPDEREAARQSQRVFDKLLEDICNDEVKASDQSGCAQPTTSCAETLQRESCATADPELHACTAPSSAPEEIRATVIETPETVVFKTDDCTPPVEAVAATPSHGATHSSDKKSGSGSYAFPSDGAVLAQTLNSAAGMSADEIVEALREMIDSECSTIELYPSIRERFCAYNIALSNRNEKAPHRRPHINGGKPKPSERKPEHDILTNDLQVIDLHWLWNDGYQPASDKWARIFSSSFDFRHATRFVTTVGATKNKADELGLSRSEMMQLQILRNDAARLRFQTIRDLMNSAKSKIREALGVQQSRQPCTPLEMSNTCQALLLADLDVHTAIKIAKQDFGLNLSQSVMIRRKKWLLERNCIHHLT